MKTNVKPYSDRELFDRGNLVTKGEVEAYRSKGVPLIIAVRSNEDEPDAFDDKVYLYSPKNEFIMATSCSTNAGLSVLKNFERINAGGAAIIKTDEFYPKFFDYGLHKGRMAALRQVKPVLHYRDNNRNPKAEQIGTLFNGIINTNLHGIDYDPNSVKVANKVGDWSAGCIVCNIMADYRKIIRYVKPFVHSDFLILQEWN